MINTWILWKSYTFEYLITSGEINSLLIINVMTTKSNFSFRYINLIIYNILCVWCKGKETHKVFIVVIRCHLNSPNPSSNIYRKGFVMKILDFFRQCLFISISAWVVHTHLFCFRINSCKQTFYYCRKLFATSCFLLFNIIIWSISSNIKQWFWRNDYRNRDLLSQSCW